MPTRLRRDGPLCEATALGMLLLTLTVSMSEPHDWPQFRGSTRDGISRETGLLQSWPEGGPRLLWKCTGTGHGYSSAALAGGALFITGDKDEQLVVSALDLQGNIRWQTTNGRAWKNPYPGARATCTVDGDRLYHMNAHGRVACLDAATGKELWTVNVLERFDAPAIRWGISECLLVDGDRVIVTPGGRKAVMAALDKQTGATVWASEPLRFMRTHRFGGVAVDPPVSDIDRAGYASPILIATGGRRVIAGASARHFICVDADSGALLWKHPVPVKFEVIGAMPLAWRDAVFFSAPDQFGGCMFGIRVQPDRVRLEELWSTPADNCHGAFVHVDGRIYGSGYRRFNEWVCLEADSGTMRYSKGDLPKGSVIYADGRLYALSESGVLLLLEPAADGFRTAGRLQLVRGRMRDVWAHPAISDGRLYLRCHDTLYCYDIRQH